MTSKTWPIYRTFKEMIKIILAKKGKGVNNCLCTTTGFNYLREINRSKYWVPPMLQDFGTRGILGNSTTIQNKQSVEGE